LNELNDTINELFYNNTQYGGTSSSKTTEGDNMIFVIFTVINLNNDTNNNPPKIPYINLNKLKYYLNLCKEYESIKSCHVKDFLEKNDQGYQTYRDNLYRELIRLKSQISQYKIYEFTDDTKNNTTINSLITDEIGVGTQRNNYQNYYSVIEKLIKYIETNNMTTLIGSLVTTDQLQNTSYTNFACSYDATFDILLKRFPTFGKMYNEFTKMTYMESKMKYIKLKEKLSNILN
jgi:hypothetical protein